MEVTENICCICHELTCFGDKILPCNHVYHHKCIDEWINIKPSCPLCSYQIRTGLKIEQITSQEFRNSFRMLLMLCYFVRFYEIISLESLD